MTHCAIKLNDQHEGCVYCVCLTGSGRKPSCEEQNNYIFLCITGLFQNFTSLFCRYYVIAS